MRNACEGGLRRGEVLCHASCWLVARVCCPALCCSSSPASHFHSTLQVLNKEFEVLTHLARTAGAFGRRDAAVALGGLVDKIHELKHKCGSCKGAVCRAVCDWLLGGLR